MTDQQDEVLKSCNRHPRRDGKRHRLLCGELRGERGITMKHNVFDRSLGKGRDQWLNLTGVQNVASTVHIVQEPISAWCVTPKETTRVPVKHIGVPVMVMRYVMLVVILGSTA